MMNLAWGLNTLWMAACRPAWQAFVKAAADPATAQRRVLEEMVRANQDTEFGRRYCFDSIDSPKAYQRRVPISDFDDYAADLDRIAAGELRVLTAEPVVLFEPTSGSSTGQKLIPYTAALRRQFQQMIGSWIYNLYSRKSAVRRGRAYWSISPAIGQRQRTSGGIPIAFEDDTAYLGPLQRRLMSRLLAAPTDIARFTRGDNFRYATLLALLRAGDLSLISVWSPTFLTALLGCLDTWADSLCRDLYQGSMSLPCADEKGVSSGKPRSRRRSRQVSAILESASHRGERTAQLWKRLAVISCWADGSAVMYLPELQQLFPTVEIQPKGLLATECCVSFPLVGRSGAALALGSHFFEFQEVDGDALNEHQPAQDKADVRLAHELAAGQRYSVIVTTGGGLYRYRLRDVVEVTGWEGRCPLLKYAGRCDARSDLVGEKLGEPHVQAVLEQALAGTDSRPIFVLLAPVQASPPHYRLYVQFARDARLASASLHDLKERIQAGLESNPYYRHAVQLGQLGCVQIQLIDSQGEHAMRIVERRWVEQGRKLGDLKPRVFDNRTDWPELLSPLACRSSGNDNWTTGPRGNRHVPD